MPEFTVKEVRLPELHLPEVKRDEIVRALSGIRVPEVDRAMAEPRRRLRNIDLRAFRWRQPRLSGIDAGKVVAAAVTAARIARPGRTRSRWSPFRRSRWDALGRSRDDLVAMVRPAPRRSRRRLAVVVIALLAACWMLFRNPGFRARLDRAAADARRRLDEMRAQGTTDAELESGEPVSVSATEMAAGGVPENLAADPATDIAEEAANPA